MTTGDGRATALDDPETRRSLSVYARSARRLLLVGLGGLLVATAVVSATNGHPRGIATVVALIGFFGAVNPLYAGISGGVRSWRMRRLLARHSWQTRPAVYRIAPFGANGQPALLVARDDTHPDTLFSVPTTVWRYRRLHTGVDGNLDIVWGGPRWAVVAPPDHMVVILVKKPWFPFQRTILRRVLRPKPRA